MGAGAGAGAESRWEKGWTAQSHGHLSGQSIRSLGFTYSLNQDLWNWENAMGLPSSVAWQRVSLSFPAGAKGPSFERKGTRVWWTKLRSMPGQHINETIWCCCARGTCLTNK